MELIYTRTGHQQTRSLIGVAFAFAVFVPMLIGVAALIRGDLENQRLSLLVAQTNAVSPVPLPAFDTASERGNEHHEPHTELITPAQQPQLQTTNDQNSVSLESTNGHYSLASETTHEQVVVREQTRSATNGKAQLSTSDVTGMLRVLHEAQVNEFANARELARLCGWSSSSSGPRALRALLDAGVVVQQGELFLIHWPEEERYANSRA